MLNSPLRIAFLSLSQTIKKYEGSLTDDLVATIKDFPNDAYEIHFDEKIN